MPPATGQIGAAGVALDDVGCTFASVGLEEESTAFEVVCSWLGRTFVDVVSFADALGAAIVSAALTLNVGSIGTDFEVSVEPVLELLNAGPGEAGLIGPGPLFDVGSRSEADWTTSMIVCLGALVGFNASTSTAVSVGVGKSGTGLLPPPCGLTPGDASLIPVFLVPVSVVVFVASSNGLVGEAVSVSGWRSSLPACGVVPGKT